MLVSRVLKTQEFNFNPLKDEEDLINEMKNNSKITFFSLKKAFTDYMLTDRLVSLGNIEFPVFLKRLG